VEKLCGNIFELKHNKDKLPRKKKILTIQKYFKLGMENNLIKEARVVGTRPHFYWQLNINENCRLSDYIK